MVGSATAAGATEVAGKVRSAATDTGGYSHRPTVLAGVRNEDRTTREEVFGPVVAGIPFEDEDEAVALANDTTFGLAGAAWSQRVDRQRQQQDTLTRVRRTPLRWTPLRAASGYWQNLFTSIRED